MNFVVTGGSRGLGRQLVLDLVTAGHNVAFTYLSASAAAAEVTHEARASSDGQLCQGFQLDQRDASAVEEVAERIVDALGGVDVLVNSAAIFRNGLIMSISDDDWHDVLLTNLTGPFLLSRAFLPHFVAARHGRFIHVSSVAMGGATGNGCYAASKAGLIGLSGTLAKEYGRRGITSNVLVLGGFEAGMWHQTGDATQAFWRNECPVGRAGRPSEVSGAVLYLASEAAAFVNGQTIGINGGLDWAP